MEIDRSGDLGEISNLGLSLDEGKRLLGRVQREIVAVQARKHAGHRLNCGVCGARCQVKDYLTRQVDTAFGRVAVCLPRFHCVGCGKTVAGVTARSVQNRALVINGQSPERGLRKIRITAPAGDPI